MLNILERFRKKKVVEEPKRPLDIIKTQLQQDITDEVIYMVKLYQKSKIESAHTHEIIDEIDRTKWLLDTKKDVLDSIRMFRY